MIFRSSINYLYITEISKSRLSTELEFFFILPQFFTTQMQQKQTTKLDWLLTVLTWSDFSLIIFQMFWGLRLLLHLHAERFLTLPSVLWRCWLGGRKGIRPVKNWVVRCWRGYLSGARCRLAYAQLMPMPLTVSCFSKIQFGLPFWYRLNWVVLDKGPLNVCVCSERFLTWTVRCIYTPWGRKIGTNFLLCASFLVLDRNWSIFHIH